MNPNRTKWEDEGDPRLAKCSEGDITLRVCYYFSESEEEVERTKASADDLFELGHEADYYTL